MYGVHTYMHICRYICIIYRAPTPLTLPPSPPLPSPSPPALPAVVSSRCLVPLTQLALLEELPVFGVARRPLQRKVSWTHHSLPEHKQVQQAPTHTSMCKQPRFRRATSFMQAKPIRQKVCSVTAHGCMDDQRHWHVV